MYGDRRQELLRLLGLGPEHEVGGSGGEVEGTVDRAARRERVVAKGAKIRSTGSWPAIPQRVGTVQGNRPAPRASGAPGEIRAPRLVRDRTASSSVPRRAA